MLTTNDGFGAEAEAKEAEPGNRIQGARIPVIYSTDLMHPHDDPDDHFDLACLYALAGADVRAVILDNGGSQSARPGYKPVWQLNYLAGRHVPCAIGLSQKLRSPGDKALTQPAEHQNGVNLLLQTLLDSTEKVVIIFVGSARDTVAAFNREPELFRAKVRGIYGFIGEASDPEYIEYNVSLDPLAFAALIRADLPFYWIPCFDGGLWHNNGHASYWVIHHRDVLEDAPEVLQRYFLFMLRKSTNDPIAYLSQEISAQDREWMMSGERNLWCAAILSLAIESPGELPVRFVPVDVMVSDKGVVSYGKEKESHQVQRFEITDKSKFAPALTKATKELLNKFPVSQKR